MTETDRGRKVAIHIDGASYRHRAGPATPAEIRAIAAPPIGDDKQIWLDIPDDRDRLLAEGERIDLADGMRFFSEVPALSITIDRTGYEVYERKMTGAQLRAVPSPDVAPDRDLWLDVPDARDRKVQDEDVVTLTDKMRFFTAPGRINPGTGERHRATDLQAPNAQPGDLGGHRDGRQDGDHGARS